MSDRNALPVWLKVTHGFGSVAYGVKENGFSVFLLIFYNQVLGLDPAVVGAAIMFALIADAFVDPVIGEMSDRTQSRWGRRLPWLYAAPIPLGLSWLLLWYPPEMSDGMTIVWLFFITILARSLVAACEVPSIALVPELTSDYDERTLLMRYRFLFGWSGGLLILILAYGVFFTGPNGLVDRPSYGAYAWCSALLMTGAVLFSAAGQHKRIARPSPPAQKSDGLGHILSQMMATLSNRAFLWLVAAALFGFINQAVSFALSNYLLTFLWQLGQYGLITYAVMLFFTMIVAFLMVGPLSAWLGKKGAAVLSAIVSIALNSALYGSWLLDLVPGGAADPNLYFMLAFVFASNCFAISLMILSSSMMADVVEASQQETGRRSEGLFFAGYFFMQKCAVGVGTFCAGLILSAAAFPQDAKAGELPVSVLDDLAKYYMLTIIVVGLTGVAILRHFPITRESHREGLEKLSTGTEAGTES